MLHPQGIRGLQGMVIVGTNATHEDTCKGGLDTVVKLGYRR